MTETWSRRIENVGSDMRLGFRRPVEDIAIAKLVVMPFVLTLVLWLGWMMPLPSLVAIVLFAALMIPATAWNAGWRARTAAA
jgi:hypothetical protein